MSVADKNNTNRFTEVSVDLTTEDVELQFIMSGMVLQRAENNKRSLQGSWK